MKKIILKMLQQVAKKNNTDISEFFSIFMVSIALNLDVEELLEDFSLNEKKVLKTFFEYLEGNVLNEIDEFSKEFITFIDIKEAFSNLAMFFTIFIPEEVLLLGDVEKIEKILSNYPDDIKEAVITSLGLLDLAYEEDMDIDLKLNILKGIVEGIIILTFMMRSLNA